MPTPAQEVICPLCFRKETLLHSLSFCHKEKKTINTENFSVAYPWKKVVIGIILAYVKWL